MGKKIALSIEQMKNLESLGLDISDASMIWDTNRAKEKHECSILDVWHKVPGDNYYNMFGVPAYTLQDILKKLPKIIETESDNFECYINLYQNYIDYRDSKHNTLLNVEFGENLLEASYQMLLWCIENNYIKTNKV